MASEETWLPTTAAARELGCSPTLLKRSRDDQDRNPGFLVATVHYRYQPAFNSPILWRVDLIRQVFHERGVLQRTSARQEQLMSTSTGAGA